MNKPVLGEALVFKDGGEWRRWLEENHSENQGVWLRIYKKSFRGGIGYNEAVDEALCFGWIDSTMKRVDDERFILRFAPRKRGSIWSRANRERTLKLMEEGRITEAGLEDIEEAKRNGRWDTAYTSRESPTIPEDLREALQARSDAFNKFINLSNSQRLMLIHWVENAKKDETRRRRIGKVIDGAL